MEREICERMIVLEQIRLRDLGHSVEIDAEAFERLLREGHLQRKPSSKPNQQFRFFLQRFLTRQAQAFKHREQPELGTLVPPSLRQVLT